MLALPNKRTRRRLCDILRDAFRADDLSLCVVAVAELSRIYGHKPPRVEFRDSSLVLGDALGAYYPMGRTILLVHPERWRAKRKQNTEDKWIAVVLHECWHHLTRADEERRADAFARRMMA